MKEDNISQLGDHCAPFCEQQYTHGSCYISLFKFKSFDQFNTTQTASNFRHLLSCGTIDYMPTANDKSFFVSPVTPEEIEINIGSLNHGKSSDHYSIPTKLLKILCSDIAIPISVIVNESFAKGLFPDKLKVAKVIALHEKRVH